mmetsp:Transcript_14741/g.27237  ORF Transcript_14741/g.27237 Transcript_14741/m.27237 type:complete len:311 (-) Transcript_14741:2107-3039(-)
MHALRAAVAHQEFSLATADHASVFVVVVGFDRPSGFPLHDFLNLLDFDFDNLRLLNAQRRFRVLKLFVEFHNFQSSVLDLRPPNVQLLQVRLLNVILRVPDRPLLDRSEPVRNSTRGGGLRFGRKAAGQRFLDEVRIRVASPDATHHEPLAVAFAAVARFHPARLAEDSPRELGVLDVDFGRELESFDPLLLDRHSSDGRFNLDVRPFQAAVLDFRMTVGRVRGQRSVVEAVDVHRAADVFPSVRRVKIGCRRAFRGRGEVGGGGVTHGFRRLLGRRREHLFGVKSRVALGAESEHPRHQFDLLNSQQRS